MTGATAPFDLQLDEIDAAVALVRRFVPPTPTYRWPLLAQRTGVDLWLKHENHTPVGAFKVRGGITYVDALRRNEPAVQRLVTATRGNHGQSIALAGVRAGYTVTIVVPHGNSVEKNAAMRALGAQLVEWGDDFDAARAHAYTLARDSGVRYVPSFDRDLVVGVATYARELFAEVVPDVVYVPIGLGSGIAGVVAVRDVLRLPTAVVGVVSERFPAYARAFAGADGVETEAAQTIADGMACRVPDAAAVAVIRSGVERVTLVSDDDVRAAMRAIYVDTHNAAEGAGAAAVAAVQRDAARLAGKKVVAVLSGGNVDAETFATVLAGPAPMVWGGSAP